jgi:hypothetical protein
LTRCWTFAERIYVLLADMATRVDRRDIRNGAIITALAFLLLLPALLLPSRVSVPTWSEYSDLLLIHWPKTLLTHQSLAEGFGWPLWSPYALSGQPLAANQLAMLFYPPAWLLLAGRLPWAFSAFLAVHMAWAGIGAYWLVRGLGRGPAAALLAAAIFVLSGKIAAHASIGHLSLVAAVAWLPWAFGCLHRALLQASNTFALLAGVALAAQATTHTYALVFTAYGLLVYAMLLLLGRPGGPAERVQGLLRQIPRLALVPLAAALLAAAQLLPLVEMAQYSNRALSLREASLFSLSPMQTLAGLLLPSASVGHEWILYPGLLTWGLVAAAWRQRRDRTVAVFALLTVVGAVLALGEYTPVYALAYRLLPGLRWMRTPARLWLFVSLGLAILAAFGADAWQQLHRGRAATIARRALVAAMGFSAMMSVGVMVALRQTGRATWGLGVFGILSGCLLLWFTKHPRPAPFAGLALLLLVADLLTFDYTLVRFLPTSHVTATGGGAIAWLAGQNEPFRTYSPSYSLPQPAAVQAGLGQIDGVEPVHLADYDRFMARAGGYGQEPFSVTIPPFNEDASVADAHRETEPDLRLLGLLNGRYLAAAFPLNLPGLALRWQEGDTWIYENQYALPRAWVVHRTQVVTHAEAWEGLDTLEPATVALVETGTPLAGTSAASAAEIIRLEPDRVVVEVRLDEPGLLVLSEIWYPGWQARDNGNRVPIVRTNAILRGVTLAAGSHTVEVTYRPWTVRVGVLTSASAALVLLAYVALRRVRPA